MTAPTFSVYLDDAGRGPRLAGLAPTLRAALKLGRKLLEDAAAELGGVDSSSLEAEVLGPSGHLCARLRPREWSS